MDSTEIYTLYAMAAVIGLTINKTNINHVAEFADIVARDMIAKQAAWAKEEGL